MRLLVVEDDPDLNRQLVGALEEAGYVVDSAKDGEEGHFLGDTEPYDAVILDLGLPEMDGVTVLEKWRRDGRTMPVLILTARDAVPERVAGLDAGADDYLIKPFDLDELSARLRSLLRRGAGRAEPVIEHRGIRMDPVTREVRLQDQPVRLSAREYAVLEALLRRPGAVLSRAQLEEHLYGWGEEVESNAVEVYIHGLRRKLGSDSIRTLRGVGYSVPA